MVSKNTVLKLLVDAARIAQAYLDREMRGLPCQRMQIDEAWAFIYAKEKNIPGAKAPPPEAGDVWTWTALCADTKLIPVWRVGDRSAETALDLVDDLAGASTIACRSPRTGMASTWMPSTRRSAAPWTTRCW